MHFNFTGYPQLLPLPGSLGKLHPNIYHPVYPKTYLTPAA